jgi:hypothetical protein
MVQDEKPPDDSWMPDLPRRRPLPDVRKGKDSPLGAAQIRAARALLDLSQAGLADLAGLSSMTVKRAEGSAPPPASAAAVAAIRAALEAAGVEFIAENGGGPGVRLRKGKT